MTERMQEIGDRLEAAACVYPATIDGHAALFNAIGERDEHAADDLVFLWERCASLEALVRELATVLSMADRIIIWEHTTAIHGFQERIEDVLSHHLVSELTGEKEGGE